MSAPEIVHLEYESFSAIPPRPDGFTRFICLSDSHGSTYPVPGCSEDILLHSGDLTNIGTLEEFEDVIKWLSELPHKFKIIIAGNHDLSLDLGWYSSDDWVEFFADKEQVPVESVRDLVLGQKARDAGIIYLQNERVSITDYARKQWLVYGTPYSVEFGPWAFGYSTVSAPDFVAQYPFSDILLSHGPPKNIFDKTINGETVGCQALAERLKILRPRLSVFGHIHEDHGAAIHSWISGADLPHYHGFGMQDDAREVLENLPQQVTLEGPPHGTERTVFVNAANQRMGLAARYPNITDEEYGGPRFRPVVVDLKH
ncbi:Metallo-dependent phosphatase-like protein [Flagelloscypha sp. PMI_526]|nr:Metallo-dependent phosphatase-like protein [Flagelloscypha sp. PMI_526]